MHHADILTAQRIPPTNAHRTLPIFDLSAVPSDLAAGAFDRFATGWERHRHARLTLPGMRTAYRHRHGAMRLCLAQRTGRRVDAIRIARRPDKKLLCVDGPDFCLSTSKHTSFLAISETGPVGLDVIALDAASGVILDDALVRPADRNMARTHFDGPIDTMIWSVKEAVLKLTGEVMRSPCDIVFTGITGNMLTISLPGHAPIAATLTPVRNSHLGVIATFQTPAEAV